MRMHFVSRLALLIAGAFLVVATQEGAWVGNTLKWLFVAGGALAVAVAVLDSVADGLIQRTIDLAIAVLGAWAIVEALTLNAADVKWWSFGTAAAIAAFAAAGLLIHEMSTERVVHELRVTDDSPRQVHATA